MHSSDCIFRSRRVEGVRRNLAQVVFDPAAGTCPEPNFVDSPGVLEDTTRVAKVWLPALAIERCFGIRQVCRSICVTSSASLFCLTAES